MNKYLKPWVVVAVIGLPSYSLYSYWQQQHDEELSSDASRVADLSSKKTAEDSTTNRSGALVTSSLSGKQTVASNKNHSSVSKQHVNSNIGTTAEPAQKELDVARKRYGQVVNNSRYPTLDARITALETLYPQQSFKPEEVVDLLAEPNAWQATTESTQELPLTPEQRSDGRKFIELKPERLLVMLPGDSLELPIEQLGANLKMKVDSREPLPNGGFILHGRLTNTDEVMRVTLTQTPGLSLAGIDTPKGHYVLQANDGQGWIASSDTLFKQEGRKTDMVPPPGS
ncbi:MAG: hypothetical protein EOO52_10895 [Gammaproteobacteria bacterium]|nr:MAG: hypothetical protein EOO52_10895 [Gammaproteobacteria bacterium]